MKNVHFENFDPQTVEGLARTQLLLDAQPDATTFERLVNDIRNIFRREAGGGRTAEILIARDGHEPEFLKVIGDYDYRVALRDRVSLRTAQIHEPTTHEWKATFGSETDLDPNTSRRLIVRFGQTTARPSVLGVSVASDLSPGFIVRLRAVVSQWIGRDPAPFRLTRIYWSFETASLGC